MAGGWITINGTHVMVDGGGRVVSGPASLRGGGGGSSKGTNRGSSAKGSAPSVSSQASNLASAYKSKSTPIADKQAIQALGSDSESIKSALTKAHSAEGYTSGAFQGADAANLAKRISKLTGENYTIEKVTEKGFMGYNFSKNVLKAT